MKSVKIVSLYFGVAMSLLVAVGVAGGATYTSMSQLGPVSISQGEQLDFKSLVDVVQLDDGEEAVVTANFSDTSELAPGRHRLVYTAITFTGRTETVVTTLDVANSTPLQDVPVFSNLVDKTFYQGDCFNLKKEPVAVDVNGTQVFYTVSVEYPEHLCPGAHTVWFTAVDDQGRSAVTNISVTVLAMEEKFRRAEWVRLGKYLYEKYFEPSRLAPYKESTFSKYLAFSYSPETTMNGIVADVVLRGVKYDWLETNSCPIKVEELTARMLGLLTELRHHRYLWQDSPNIIFEVEERGHLNRSGESAVTKERGLYAVVIPNSIFRQDDFDVEICNALQELATASGGISGRNDGKGATSHCHITASNGIEILFMQDLIEYAWWSYKSRWEDGSISLEDKFIYPMFYNEYQNVKARLESGGFGRFTNPKLPMLKMQ